MHNHAATLRIGLAGALIAGLVVAAGTAGAAPEPKQVAAHHHLQVRGSARQVDVSGVAANAKLALIRAGQVVATKRANSLGGAIFFNVRPGTGYRVRVLSSGATSSAVTAHTNRSKPWDPKVYHQAIPDSGIHLLTRIAAQDHHQVWPLQQVPRRRTHCLV